MENKDIYSNRNSDLPKSAQISLVKPVLKKKKKVHLCVTHDHQH